MKVPCIFAHVVASAEEAAFDGSRAPVLQAQREAHGASE